MWFFSFWALTQDLLQMGQMTSPFLTLARWYVALTLLIFKARTYANRFEDINLEVVRLQEFLHLGV